MGGQGDTLLFFQHWFYLLIINILEPVIIFAHGALHIAFVPYWQVTMEFIIFAEHLYFLGKLFLLVHPLHVLLIIIVVIIILELNIDGWDGLLKYFVELLGEVEILWRRILAVEWMGNKGDKIAYILPAHIAVLAAAAI